MKAYGFGPTCPELADVASELQLGEEKVNDAVSLARLHTASRYSRRTTTAARTSDCHKQSLEGPGLIQSACRLHVRSRSALLGLSTH